MQTGLCLGIDFVHVWSAYTFLCENLLPVEMQLNFVLSECLLVTVFPKHEYTKSCVIVVCISQSGAHYCPHILCSTMHGCQLSGKTGTELIAPELLVQVCRLLGQGRTWLRTSQWEATACLHLYMCSLWMRVVYLGVWGELL